MRVLKHRSGQAVIALCENWTVKSPTPKEIKQAREDAGLTQSQAAEKIFSDSSRSWQDYERGERGMHPAIWWCFLQRTRHLRTKSR